MGLDHYVILDKGKILDLQYSGMPNREDSLDNLLVGSHARVELWDNYSMRDRIRLLHAAG